MDVEILSPGQFWLTKTFAGQVAAAEFTSEDLFFLAFSSREIYVYTFFESTINL